MRYFFHTTFVESNSNTFVVDTDGYSPKTTSFPKLILVGRLPSAEHARNCYSSLVRNYETVTQPRLMRPGERVSSLIETKKQTNKQMSCRKILSFCLWTWF